MAPRSAHGGPDCHAPREAAEKSAAWFAAGATLLTSTPNTVTSTANMDHDPTPRARLNPAKLAIGDHQALPAWCPLSQFSSGLLGTLNSSSVAPQMLHDGIEFAGRGLHPGVRLPHAPAGVGAGTAGGLTQLVDDLLLKPRDVRSSNSLLIRSSPPTRATHDSVAALIASRPPSRSYSELVCVVIYSPLHRLVRPVLCSRLESRLAPQPKSLRGRYSR